MLKTAAYSVFLVLFFLGNEALRSSEEEIGSTERLFALSNEASEVILAVKFWYPSSFCDGYWLYGDGLLEVSKGTLNCSKDESLMRLQLQPVASLSLVRPLVESGLMELENEYSLSSQVVSELGMYPTAMSHPTEMVLDVSLGWYSVDGTQITDLRRKIRMTEPTTSLDLLPDWPELQALVELQRQLSEYGLCHSATKLTGMTKVERQRCGRTER